MVVQIQVGDDLAQSRGPFAACWPMSERDAPDDPGGAGLDGFDHERPTELRGAIRQIDESHPGGSCLWCRHADPVVGHLEWTSLPTRSTTA